MSRLGVYLPQRKFPSLVGHGEPNVRIGFKIDRSKVPHRPPWLASGNPTLPPFNQDIMSISVPEPFHDSCLFWSEYPLNIVDKSLYGRRLHGYRRRLLMLAPAALVQDEGNFRIPTTDILDDLSGKKTC